ncbi:MAG: hypothetical protein VYC43_02755 [Pseudomonadota bacterium]|nr:hypothetical protein [Pseudomonadota bacterium]MEC9414473.1 hypothetical protein [Pseudomonadota bacterium]
MTGKIKYVEVLNKLNIKILTTEIIIKTNNAVRITIPTSIVAAVILRSNCLSNLDMLMI